MTISSRSWAFTALSFVFALGAAGCGSSSSNGGGGANGSKGGSTGSLGGSTGSLGGKEGSQGGTTGTTGTGGVSGVGGSSGTGGASGVGGTSGVGGASGACPDVPPCLTALANSCVPSGTCVTQTTTDAATGVGTINSCYTNGVKQAIAFSVDATTGIESILETVSKSGTTCYSLSAMAAATVPPPDTVTYAIKNGAGATVATLTTNATTGVETVSCGGQTYDVTNAGDCGPMPMGTTSDCTDGTCQ